MTSELDRCDAAQLSRRVVTLAAVLIATMGCVACVDFVRGAPFPEGAGGEGPPAGGDGDGDLSFAADVLPLLMGSCESCHSQGGQAAQTAFVLTGDASADFDNTVNLVDTARPSQSRLVSNARGQGHGGGAIFPAGSTEDDLLLQWIAAGAAP